MKKIIKKTKNIIIKINQRKYIFDSLNNINTKNSIFEKAYEDKKEKNIKIYTQNLPMKEHREIINQISEIARECILKPEEQKIYQTNIETIQNNLKAGI
jgi:hypothetical protein